MEIAFRLDLTSLYIGLVLGWLSVVLLILGIGIRQWKKQQKASKKQK
jgi:hypothetical protein